MADQPRHEPLTPSSFFEDGRSARPRIPGTVARGELADDSLQVPSTETAFPLPVTEELFERGQRSFDIHCSVCHGLAGDGDGMIPRRGFPRPPSFHSDHLRSVPVGHLYDVISNGMGTMPRYGPQIPPRDRWAIIAYIRALQFSQHAAANDLPPNVQELLEENGNQ
jgi:mono/diheme cytochrome c family protein